MIPIVSFYTIGTPYEQEAQEMKNSAHDVGLTDVRLYPVSSKGSWERNCQQKAEIIQRAAHDLCKPFLYVDSDARFQEYPHMLEYAWDQDIAIHYFKGKELLSGTIWMNPSHATYALLAMWNVLNIEQPRAWDQKTLHQAIQQQPDLKVLRLPTEYCYIYDLSKQHYGERQAIVTHYQASRKYKRGIK